MTTPLSKAKAKRAARPIYGELMRVAVLATGEERIAWVAMHDIDRALMRERGWKCGDEVRAEFKKARNVPFHRLAHAIGKLLVDNVDGFESLDSHAAIKRVQRESGVCCDEFEMDAQPVVQAMLAAADEMLGTGARKVLESVLAPITSIPVKEPRSIAFDSMPADEFEQFFNGITDYIERTYASAMLDDVRADYFEMREGSKP